MTQLLEMSRQIVQFSLHKKKYEFLIEKYYDHHYIQNASPEELACVISGEYLAFVLNKLNIFKNAYKDVPKVRPGHFFSGSDVELPWNKEIIQYISKEFYLFLDFQVYMEELKVRESPTIPKNYPCLQKEVPPVFLRDCFDLDRFNLSSGDLVFFSEVSEVAKVIQQFSGEEYTRVAMILRIPGISIPFIYDSPPFFVAHYESDKPRFKFIQGRLVTLDSFIQTGNFSKIMFRKLTKYGGESFKNPTINRANISRTKSIFQTPRKNYNEMNENSENGSSHEKIYSHFQFEKEGDEEWMMIREFFKEFKKSYDFGQAVDIGSLFSAKIVALTYKSLGLVDKESGITVKSLRETKKFEKDYLLGPELEVKPFEKKSSSNQEKETIKEEKIEEKVKIQIDEKKIEKQEIMNNHKTPTAEEIEIIQKQVEIESTLIQKQIEEQLNKKEEKKEVQEMTEEEKIKRDTEEIEKLKKKIEGNIENMTQKEPKDLKPLDEDLTQELKPEE